MKPPSVELVLALDKEYREKASTGKLKKIAPKKLNPEGKAWLPIMNVEREVGGLLSSSPTRRKHTISARPTIGWLCTSMMGVEKASARSSPNTKDR